jgi:hypothetical protein
MTRSTSSNPQASRRNATVGRWRVLGRVGSGNNGIIYEVCIAEHPSEGVYALKMARESRDPRFEREAELLSRLAHPHVPRLMERGVWKGPLGREYPFLVMQWVEGVPLYDWAARRGGITSRQALRLLAQLARALEAVHAVGAVHRDVKGDNVLVTSEGHAVLLDFGCCSYEGARPLTDTTVPPGTRPYRSPQCLCFKHRFQNDFHARYEHRPEDDLYSLGVTAYFLVTGTYPPPGTDPERCEEEGRASAPRKLPPSELATLAPELEALMLRMLSEYPAVRGTAASLAEALERAAVSAGPQADLPVRPTRAMLPTERAPRPGPTRWQLAGQAARRVAKHTSMALFVAGALAVCLAAVLLLPPSPERPAHFAPEEEQAAAERVGVADAGVDGSMLASVQPTYRVPGVREPIPEKPERGWKRPPCRPDERAINGACWYTMTRKPPCEEAYEHGAECLLPIQARTGRPTTSQEP